MKQHIEPQIDVVFAESSGLSLAEQQLISAWAEGLFLSLTLSLALGQSLDADGSAESAESAMLSGREQAREVARGMVQAVADRNFPSRGVTIRLLPGQG